MVEGLKAFIRNENILLVDEVADSGETYLVAIDYLQKLKPAKIFSCAPFIKSWTKYIPDYWQKKTDKWIIFPYETKESIDELGKTMDKNKIKSLGLPAQFVDYFFKKAKIAAPRG